MAEGKLGKWGEAFWGRPFEGLGNAWGAIFGDDINVIFEQVREFCTRGEVVKNRVRAKDAPGEYTYYEYPEYGMLRICVLTKQEPSMQRIMSMYPVMNGIANKLYIMDFKPWKNGLEGMVSAHTDNTGMINFYDPYYATDAFSLRIGDRRTFRMAALALRCEKAKDDVTVIKTPSALRRLFRWIKRSKEDDVVHLHFQGAKILYPTEYTGEFQFRTTVESLETCTFISEKIYRYKVSFGDPGGEGELLNLYLYVPERTIQGMTPDVGDDIQGFFWFSGALVMDN